MPETPSPHSRRSMPDSTLTVMSKIRTMHG